MTVCLTNLSLSDYGGGNRVAMTILDELLRIGEEVKLVTTHKPDIKKVRENFEVDLSKVEVFYLCEQNIRKLELLTYLAFYKIILKTIQKYNFDKIIFFDDVVDPLYKINSCEIILYAHFPLSIMYKYNILLNIPKKHNYKYILYVLKKKFYNKLFNRSKDADIIISNSTITSKFIRKAWGRQSEIIYPPVRINTFYSLEKRDQIVMIGRISPSKNIEVSIRALALSETKPTLYIIGFLDDYRYFCRLRKTARALKIAHKIKFMPNAKFDDLKKVVGHSKIFLHAAKNEPFGIAVVEGMSAGCVPIVYKDWGPWIDIVKKGKYGLGFENEEELAENIDMIISDEKKFNKFSKIAQKRAKVFSEEKFRENIRRVLA